jgi:hypothetical protein
MSINKQTTKPLKLTQELIRAFDENSSARTRAQTFKDVSDSNIEQSQSFRYDPAGVGLKSSQQLNIDFCLGLGTKVLCADLIWRKIEDLTVGVELIGFEENIGTKNTKLKPSFVMSTSIKKLPCYKITTTKGEIIASSLHKWVSKKEKVFYKQRRYQWIKTEDLRLGDKIAFYADPWSSEKTLETEYLAGFYEGEGWVSNCKVGVGQTIGDTSNDIILRLKNLGFNLAFSVEMGTKSKKKNKLYKRVQDFISITPIGDYNQSLKLLGMIRPQRLLKKSRILWENKRVWGNTYKPAIVLKIEFIGESEVVALGTSTNTLIADGYLTHNSKFENHTFFNSAVANVNTAFDTIINTFPFDGTKKDYEKFFDSLTGFEKYVYDKWPKNVGFLFFSGTQVAEDTNGTKGTWISVNPYAGGLYPNLSKNKTATSILSFTKPKSFSIECQLFVPQITNDIQVVCQHLSSSINGFSLFLTQSASTTTCDLIFGMVSGTNSLFASTSLEKGKFSHICATYNKENSYNKLQLFVSESLRTESSASFDFNELSLKDTFFIIGSGSQITTEKSYLPKQTFSGALDDFRFFHSIRSIEQQKLFGTKAIFSSPDLKLYFKFNEPTGTISKNDADTLNRIVLDSSGNSLHALINSSGFWHSLRSTGSLSGTLTNEKRNFAPVLFPFFSGVYSLNNNLLLTASAYDSTNPSLITKLVPPHYFYEGQLFDGMDETGSLGNTYQASSIPGSGKLGSAQVLSSFLYVTAKFFDEIKIFIDTFSTLKYVDYNTKDTVPDNFLPLLSKLAGFDLTSLFKNSSIEQFVEGENIQDLISTNQYSLKVVQNQILRRILTNLQEFIQSKGTLHSVKTFLRAFGINPDNSLRIREFGGPTKRQLTHVREQRSEIGTLLSMSLGSKLVSSYLSQSRVEVGNPKAVGNFSSKAIFSPHGISSEPSDGLLTSGSWTYEAIYKFPKFLSLNSATQSLCRFEVTGTNTSAASGGVLFNLLAISSSNALTSSQVKLYGRPASGSSLMNAPLLSLSLNADIFNGNKWNISFGKERNDSIRSNFSSSYFLRAARQNNGKIVENNFTSSLFLECSTPASGSVLSLLFTGTVASANVNASGTFIYVGSQSLALGTDTQNYQFLNNTALVTDTNAQFTIFEGHVGSIRFWSKALKRSEWEEHVRNYRSLGTSQPNLNFGFNTTVSGAFERLRVDANGNQPNVTTDPNGSFTLFDFSQNNLHFSGSGFPANTTVIKPELYYFSTLSPEFDEASTSEKVRIRSFEKYENVVMTPWAAVAPVSRIEPSESPEDDPRFSIEFSVIDSLNKDIVNIFSTFDILNNTIGAPENMFSPDYPNLETLRDVYFNRLTNKVNIKAFYELFKWIDMSIGSVLEQLIPAKTKFYGMNYTIQSPMLERAKVEYYHMGQYLGENFRNQKLTDYTTKILEGGVKKL